MDGMKTLKLEMNQRQKKTFINNFWKYIYIFAMI